MTSTYETLKAKLKANPKTWLITGVAGFIGSNLLETLLNLNQKVVGLDNFSTGHQKNIDEALAAVDSNTQSSPHTVNPKPYTVPNPVDPKPSTVLNPVNPKPYTLNRKAAFTLIEGDIRNLDDCQKACTGVNYVLHQAALGSVPRSIEDPITTNENNISGFLNMLVASRDANVKRMVYAASSSTYGDHPDLPKVENKIGNPLSPYAVTKLVNELYADVFARTYGFKTIGLRYFNIFGQRQDPNGAYAAVIPKWFSALLNGETVYINGDGETSRDFCFIENAVQANLLAATVKNEDATNQVYNVAFGERTSLTQLYNLIVEKLSANCKLQNANLKYRDFRLGDVKHSLADISKARNLFGYNPDFSVRDGLDKAARWYMDNLS